MTKACICRAVPKRAAITLLGAKGETLATFHKDCPVHGIQVVAETFNVLRPVRQWFTRGEMVAQVVKLRRLEGLKLIEVSPDQQRGLLEWLAWVPAETAVPEAA